MPEKSFLPYFPFFPRDWLLSARVRCLTLAQRGIYIELLSLCWVEGQLEDDPARLAVMVSDPAVAHIGRYATLDSHQDDPWETHEKDVAFVLDEFFPLGEDGFRYNPRLDQIRREAEAEREARVRGGKAAAAAKLSAKSAHAEHQPSPAMQKQKQKQSQKQKQTGATPPNPPRAGARVERPWAAALDKHLDGLEDRAGWEAACEEWASVRRGAGHKPWKASTWSSSIAKWVTWGLGAFRASVQHSASQGYQGLIEPQGRKTAPTPETSERARMEREGLGLFGNGNGRVIDVHPS